MSVLSDYLTSNAPLFAEQRQTDWSITLKQHVMHGHKKFSELEPEMRNHYLESFRNRVRTEELKAWYGAREGESLFQGTSVSSLTIPSSFPDPVDFNNPAALETHLAEQYIVLHDKHELDVEKSILEDTSHWRREGIFYGVVIASKVLSQAFGLYIDASSVFFDVDGTYVDPHEITTYHDDVRQGYFEICCERIHCFESIDGLTQAEIESSLILADISKPKIDNLSGKLLLAPIKVNDICAILSKNVSKRIHEMTKGRISPRSLMVTVYDTDTPSTYHEIMGYSGKQNAPILPGLVVMGCSGGIDAFRWLYAYRTSLIAQKMMKSSLYSEVARDFVPFVYFGVLVERDAEILLDLENLDLLRYSGNLSPALEFAYLFSSTLEKADAPMGEFDSPVELEARFQSSESYFNHLLHEKI